MLGPHSNLSGQKISCNLQGLETNHATSLKFMLGYFEFVTVYLDLVIVMKRDCSVFNIHNLREPNIEEKTEIDRNLFF